MVEASRVAVTLAYLGGAFAGWQRQPRRATVQAALEAALAKLYGGPVPAVGAGRTDAGVHATGQVAHFDPPLVVPLRGIARALNAALPPEVRVLRARRVPPTFHARRSARGKRYRYRLACGPTLPPWEALRRAHVPHSLDAARMAAALPAVVGEHDFAAFALSGHAGRGRRGTSRIVTAASLRTRGRRFDIVLEGDGFLRGMVRRIAGALVEIGRGAREAQWLADLLLDSATRPPAPTAPAHGLTLERVFYDR
ncbi:MAG TPA: tRNA pseudouridine(38-40) synthase TruA [Thermoanaerobaculaceae bacterium]|nr:tRNA pseudouridine(38-40) synthase TruA [Thermoanaerobaculaceae bacterium]